MENKTKDVMSGVIFVLAGGCFLLASMSLTQGSIINMGPGFYPTAVASLLIIIGSILTLRSIFWKY